ncbi:MAG: DUF3120 domain-containing protein [Leptolyngbyaceae cyanobacterium bins.349]|nr:DUF3120 domain-containing protein [Leptolyngbyaceae cyanobacterium bins.349]
MISYTSATSSPYSQPEVYSSAIAIAPEANPSRIGQRGRMFAAAIALVSVPVFIQAPLVRTLPLLSLVTTLLFLLLGRRWLSQPRTHHWGDLTIGFAWTWLAGSVYWGWFRWEPFLHLPIEAIGLPFALWGIAQNRGKIGNFFYLGSLLGTVVTDIFFYLVDLIPFWRTLMVVDEASAQPIFQAAIAKVQTPWGVSWAMILAVLLLLVSLVPLRSQTLHWWAFSGAVLSTILVDSLFWFAACAA